MWHNAVKAQRKIEAQDTLTLVKRGIYNLSDSIVNLPQVEKGYYWSSEKLDSLISVENKIDCNVFDVCEISVVKNQTLEVLIDLNNKGAEGIGVLNFASAYSPGGAFLRGAMAQEEALAYCSDLYDTQIDTEYYDNNKLVNSKFYTDGMLVGTVNFFKTTDYTLMQPIVAKVITSCAVNVSRLESNADILEVRMLMKKRMQKILMLFKEAGCETLILGAFGCGVFGNDSVMIAELWCELLIDLNFKKYFKEVIFAVHDRKAMKDANYKVFKNVIETKLT